MMVLTAAGGGRGWPLFLGWRRPMQMIEDSIDGDTSFDFKEILLAIVKDKCIAAAEGIKDSFGDETFSKDTVCRGTRPAPVP